MKKSRTKVTFLKVCSSALPITTDSRYLILIAAFIWDKLSNFSFLLQSSRLESQIPAILNVAICWTSGLYLGVWKVPQGPFFYEVCAQSSSLCSHHLFGSGPRCTVCSWSPCMLLPLHRFVQLLAFQIFFSYRSHRTSGPWSIPVPWRLSHAMSF